MKKQKMIRFTFDVLFTDVLRRMYFGGPKWLGFWQGRSSQDVCTIVAPGTNQEFWTTIPGADMCADMLDTMFSAWLVTIEFIFTVLVVCVTTSITLSCLKLLVFRRYIIADLTTAITAGGHPHPKLC